METNFEQVFEKVSSSVKDMVNTETVIGDEFKIGEFTCKPVIKVGVGYGTGKGEGNHPKHNQKGNGQGAGAAMGIAPIGFLVAKGDEISFISADSKKGLSAIFDKVPDLIEKIMEMKKEKEKEE